MRVGIGGPLTDGLSQKSTWIWITSHGCSQYDLLSQYTEGNIETRPIERDKRTKFHNQKNPKNSPLLKQVSWLAQSHLANMHSGWTAAMHAAANSIPSLCFVAFHLIDFLYCIFVSHYDNFAAKEMKWVMQIPGRHSILPENKRLITECGGVNVIQGS